MFAVSCNSQHAALLQSLSCVQKRLLASTLHSPVRRPSRSQLVIEAAISTIAGVSNQPAATRSRCKRSGLSPAIDSRSRQHSHEADPAHGSRQSHQGAVSHDSGGGLVVLEITGSAVKNTHHRAAPGIGGVPSASLTDRSGPVGLDPSIDPHRIADLRILSSFFGYALPANHMPSGVSQYGQTRGFNMLRARTLRDTAYHIYCTWTAGSEKCCHR